MSAPKHTPGPCGAVFRASVNAPTSCALRPNHPGPHRGWYDVADDRAELLKALRVCWHSMDRHDEPGSPAHDGAKAQAQAALAKADGK